MPKRKAKEKSKNKQKSKPGIRGVKVQMGQAGIIVKKPKAD